MKAKNLFALGGAIAIASWITVGCGGSSTTTTTTTTRGPIICVWTTASVPASGRFKQVERLARPIVNEVFATVANNRHDTNNKIGPDQDNAEILNDIFSFMTTAAGRSPATIAAVQNVLVPDVMKVDLSQTGVAAYLGVETGGATGGRFGGRKLTDDIVDTSLGVVFGTTISALGLAPNDGRAIATLTSDNVAVDPNVSIATFPYLGNPR